MYQYFPKCERYSAYYTVILPSTMSKKNSTKGDKHCHDIALHDAGLGCHTP